MTAGEKLKLTLLRKDLAAKCYPPIEQDYREVSATRALLLGPRL